MSAATKLSTKSLPDDPELLKQMVLALESENAALREYLINARHRLFGRSSEQADPGQGELFAEMFNEAELTEVAEAAMAEQDAMGEQPEGSATEAKSKRPGRKPLPADLPRIRIEHDIAESEKTCGCGCERHLIGEQTSEQLDIIPAKVQVLVHVRKTYACRSCDGSVITADKPAEPLPKSNATAGTLAHIVTAKYQDALPLYRQEDILGRMGIDLPRNTLASWMIRAGERVSPLIDRLTEHIHRYPVLHCDETPVQVLKEDGKRATSQSYMWVLAGGPPTQPVRIFHYAPSRSGEVVYRLLERYEGFLHTDDFAGYNAVAARPGVTQLGCWAHVRRKFVEAQRVQPKGKTGKADIAIGMIQKLYRIEREIKQSDAETRVTVRQEKAVPILNKIRAWLDDTLHKTLPKGALGRALGYMEKNWPKLIRYTEDGRAAIDNNAAENAIRPFVVGRKNWLFSSSVQGATASANLYSLIETAKANGLEPYAYLRTVFERLPRCESADDLDALLPWSLATDA